jgi:hypothetical protein
MWGLAFKKADPLVPSEVLRGKDAIEYIKAELLAIEPVLDNTTGTGRITQAAVQGLLARVYLNYGVYTNIYTNATFAQRIWPKWLSIAIRSSTLPNYGLAN